MMHPESLNSDQEPVDLGDEDVFAAFTHIGVDTDDKLTPRAGDATWVANILQTDLPDFEPSHANLNGGTNTSLFTPTGRPDSSLSSWNAFEPTLCTVRGPEDSKIGASSAFSFGEQAPQQDLTNESTCHAETIVPAAILPAWGSGILWCSACNRNGALDNVYQMLFIWLMRQLGFDHEDRKWRIFQKGYHVAKKSDLGSIIAGANNRHAVASFIALCCYACYIQHDCSCSSIEKMKANGFEGDRLPRRTINQCYETIRRIDDSKWKRLSKEDLPPTSEQRRKRACNDLSRYSPAESMSMQTMGFNRSIPSGGLLTDTFVDCRSLSLGRKGTRNDTDTSLACPPLCSPRFVLPKPSIMVQCTAETMRSGSLALSVSCRPSTCCAVKSPKRRAG
jgi:hypothetical protein